MTDSKQQSNPFSTGGGGTVFENRVQAAFVVLMLTGQIAPCLPPWPIVNIKLQGRYSGFNIDDFILFTKDPQTEKEAKLLAQIKHTISITEGNETFGEVIQAAWNDFNNPRIFTVGNDAFALITGPLSAAEINNTRTILEWARHSVDEKEFFYKVNLANFSSDAKRAKIKIFHTHLNNANCGTDVSDEQLWKFLKSFYLLGYDLDMESGTTLSLLQSLIAQSATGAASSLWSRVVDIVQSINQTSGTVTLSTLPADIVSAFNTRLNSHWASDLKRLKDHGDYIINGIRTSIGGVHISRSDIFDRLLEITEGAEFVFLSGERGCGKSSLVKEFTEYMKDRAPIFCLRTEDLDKAHLDNVFSVIGLTSSINELEAGFALIPKKYLLIESLEKLLELQNTAAFTDLIHFVRKHPGWTIIASGRDYAYQQITLHFLRPTGIYCSSLLIKDFSEDDIEYLCNSIELFRPLSNNLSIKTLFKKPYYAELAYRIAETGTEFSSGDGEKEFRTAVWRDVISKEHIRVNGMPLRRKQTFIDVALTRAKQMVYGVPEKAFDSDALLKLEEDNIVRRDTSNGLVSPAHDVLEDWALERYIEEVFQTNVGNILGFLIAVGHEPAMNRAFRLWLHQKIRSGENVTHLVLNIMKDKEIESCWQDETISAILLGDTSYEFLSKLKDQLFENDGKLLKHFFFILRIACKTLDQDMIKQLSYIKTSQVSDTLFLKPYGCGWESIILFLFEHKDSISPGLLSHISAVLNEWSSLVHVETELPAPSREVGLLAIHLLNMVKDSYRDEGYRKELITVIIKVIPSILKEFENLMENDLFKTYDKGRRPHYVKDFCVLALTGFETVFLCKHVPDILMKLASHEWLIDESKKNRHNAFGSHMEMEECFGIHKFKEEANFFPPSGAKGPFQQLLRFNPRKGLDFILELLNLTAARYALSDLDSPERYSLPILNARQSGIEQVEIRLNDGTSVGQFCSERLWLGYRGHSVIPYLLQSALMALENWLIDISTYSKSPKQLEWIFDYILRNSNSVMSTAVLASVAIGISDKLGKAALPILRTPELYDFDLRRTVHERGEHEVNWHKMGANRDPLDIFTEERRTAALRPWRKDHLEDLLVRLQFSDLRSEALTIIDNLRAKVPNEEKWRFRFLRIDSRDWKPELDNENNRIIFTNKELEPDLEVIQQKTQEEIGLSNRFSALLVWSEKILKREILERDYYSSWNDALTEAKKLFEIVTSGTVNDLSRMQFGGIVKAAAIFLRDHSKELHEDDLSWCFELVVETVLIDANTDDRAAILDKTDHDGAAAAASVLPIMLEFAKENDDKIVIKKIIATALTNANENVRIETACGIRERLWQIDTDFAQLCIVGSIEYALLKLEESKRKSGNVWEVSTDEDDEESVFPNEWLEGFREQLAYGEVTTDINNISFDTHSSWHIFIPSLMIPNGSIKENHISLFSQMLTLIFEAEESKIRNYDEYRRKTHIPNEVYIEFIKRFADYLLSLSDKDVQIFVEQLRSGCDTAPHFINWLFINIEFITENIGQKEQYWKLWGKISGKVQEIALSIAQNKTRNSDDKTKLIRGILHADTPWQKVDYEKKDIAIGKDFILEFVNNAGENPDVFGGMASLMYHFPSIFLEPGLFILSNHQKRTGGIQLFSSVNTAFYLERCIQRLLLHDNTGPLPRAMHQSCSVLLDAIIETASSGAYFLREHLIRSHRIMN